MKTINLFFTVSLVILGGIINGNAQGTDAVYGPTEETNGGNVTLGNNKRDFANSPAKYNILIGTNAGTYLTGEYNTYIGAASGQGSPTGSAGINNIGLGTFSLFHNTGNYNIGIGYQAGQSNTGDNNVIIGYQSGVFLTTGGANTLLGISSGNSLTEGNNNLLLGESAGLGITTGSNNVFIGKSNGGLPSDLRNTIILADGEGIQKLCIAQNGNVGIGLGYVTTLAGSGIPQNKLEVNTASGIPGQSGLRLTNLKNSSTTVSTTNPTNNVLSVDEDGDVILVADKQGTGSSVPVFTEVDGSTTNELSNLLLTGNVLTLTNPLTPGNSVTLPAFTGSSSNIYNKSDKIVTQTPSEDRIVTLNGHNLVFDTTIGNNKRNRVYIGGKPNFPTTKGDYRLYVEGGILTEKVKVALRATDNWADYVFANNYKLMSLNDVETFIKTNKHLPGVSSSEELVKDGLDLADMQAKQMSKIEELTLYVIEQNKQLEKQSKEIEELKSLLKTLVSKNK